MIVDSWGDRLRGHGVRHSCSCIGISQGEMCKVFISVGPNFLPLAVSCVDTSSGSVPLWPSLLNHG